MGDASTLRPPPWMLVAAAHAAEGEPGSVPLRKRPVLVAVARRGLPNLIEATIIPAVLFFVIVTTVNASLAMALVLAWSYVAVLRRAVRGERIPAILLLATMGLTLKTGIGLASGSTFVYFLQPIATTVALAGVFLGSVLVGRPVIGHLAHDFCPIAPEVASRPAVVHLFAGLTVLWAGVHLLNAATTLGMLVSMSVPAFVVLKTVASFGITVAAVVVTIVWALRTARNEQLTFAAA